MTEPTRGFAQHAAATKHENVPSYGFKAMRERNDRVLLSEMDPQANEYGSKGIAVPSDDARAICMREAAAEELKHIPVDEPGRVGIAWRRAAARHAQLIPDYSPWNTRQRRARG